MRWTPAFEVKWRGNEPSRLAKRPSTCAVFAFNLYLFHLAPDSNGQRSKVNELISIRGANDLEVRKRAAVPYRQLLARSPIPRVRLSIVTWICEPRAVCEFKSEWTRVRQIEAESEMEIARKDEGQRTSLARRLDWPRLRALLAREYFGVKVKTWKSIDAGWRLALSDNQQ